MQSHADAGRSRWASGAAVTGSGLGIGHWIGTGDCGLGTRRLGTYWERGLGLGVDPDRNGLETGIEDWIGNGDDSTETGPGPKKRTENGVKWGTRTGLVWR